MQKNRLATTYVYVIILVGLPIFLVNLINTLFLSDLRWLFLALATVVATWFAIRLPLFKNNSLGIAVGDCFVFAAFLLFNPVVAMVIAGTEAVMVNRRHRVKQLSKKLFNISQAFLVAFIIAHLFYQWIGTSAPMDPTTLSVVTFLEIMGCALLYFVLNTALVAVAVALSAGQPLLALWRKRLILISPANFFNVCGALIIFLIFRPVHFSIPTVLGLGMVVILLVLSVLYTKRISLAASHS